MSIRHPVRPPCLVRRLCLGCSRRPLWCYGCSPADVSSGSSSWMICSRYLRRCVLTLSFLPLPFTGFPRSWALEIHNRCMIQLLTDTSFVIMIFIYVVFHEARHTWDIPPRDRYYMRKLGFVFNIMFAEAACQSKLSLLFFTYKMIGAAKYGTFYSHYICLIILMSIVAICEVLFVILACLECRYVRLAMSCMRFMRRDLTSTAPSRQSGTAILHILTSASIVAYSFLSWA